jgi:hypothetical protein
MIAIIMTCHKHLRAVEYVENLSIKRKGYVTIDTQLPIPAKASNQTKNTL